MTLLASREAGSGDPLLLIKGYAASGADWDPTFVEALARKSRVLMPDNPGFGDSELGTGELTIEGMAAGRRPSASRWRR